MRIQEQKKRAVQSEETANAKEEWYEFWLASICGISDAKKRKLREYMKSAKEAYYIEETELKQMLFLTEADKHTIIQAKKNEDLKRQWEHMKSQGIHMVLYCDDSYPKRLKEITDTPYAVYYKGELPRENQISVAMVGARNCTKYGETCAIRFAQRLAECGVQIISGLARGIDGSSQRGALMGNGKTFAVLGCGVDICYPREHIGLYMDILEHGGGILSELPPGSRPFPFHFPRRNRIISGLSDRVLVMEAKEKSGSLITADAALEQGKDVWALPGPIDSELSKGCNRLISQGAGILTSPENLLEDLKIPAVDFCGNQRENHRETKKMLETDENMVYSSVGLYPKSVEELLKETKLPAAELVGLLAALEIKGYIQEISKNYYIKAE